MKNIIKKFDQFLSENDEEFEMIIIGGGALVLLGIISRSTRDIDCLSPEIPAKIKKLSEEFAKNSGLSLNKDWLNNGPQSIVNDLSPGWRDRLQLAFKGESITLHTLSRIDLIKTKISAMCARGSDLNDVINLKPTLSELTETRSWLLSFDNNDQKWSKIVDSNIDILKKKLGYE